MTRFLSRPSRRPRHRRHPRAVAIAATAMFLGCGDASDTPVTAGTTGVDTMTGSGESTGLTESFAPDVQPPVDHGMDLDALEELRAWAFQSEMNTQAVLVVRHGVVAGEWYAEGTDSNAWVTSWSMAKTVSATLVAIAIDDGLIPSLDEPMTTYIPEWSRTPRASITIRDVIGMTTGLAWEENFADLVQMALSADQLAYAVEQEVETEPGEVWNYASGATMLLSPVIEQATGMHAEDYAQQELAGPLGFERFEWWADGGGNTLTYCCIDATARDFARLGGVYLNRGEWEGQRLFDETWVDEFTRPQGSLNPSYGLGLWTNREGGTRDQPSLPRTLYWAQGHDHQLLLILPEQDMVVLRHSTFVRPEGDAVAPTGLRDAGMLLRGLSDPTGSFPPGDAWDDAILVEMALNAVVD